jgi:hypothetical protein
MNTKAIYLLKKAQAALAEADALQQEAFATVPESATGETDVAYLIHIDIENCIDYIDEWIGELETRKEGA